MSDTNPALDANHTLRYEYIQARRLFRKEIRGNFTPMIHAGADFCNSLFRLGLGCAAFLFGTLAGICSRLEAKCYREGTIPSNNTVEER